MSAKNWLLKGRQLKQEEKAQKKEKKQTVLFKNKIKCLEDEKQRLIHTINELHEQIEALTAQKEEKENIILQDLLLHHTNRSAQYSAELLSLAIELKTISPKAYKVLTQRLPFPKSSKVEQTMNEIVEDIPQQLQNLEQIDSIVDLYKDKHHIQISNKNKLQCCLAVDALYFTPEVKFKEDGEIEGIQFSEVNYSISKKALSCFTKNPREIDNFLTLNGDNLIRAGFVFQIQPYDIRFPPFVVHILPSVNGKANDQIVNILHQIRQKLKKRNIVIKSYAFDGDNAYHELHRIYYQSYINLALKRHQISFRTNTIRVVSDYLHILKRLRYRLLSTIIHAGFSIENENIDLEKLMHLLKVSEVCFSNDLYTKMHDSLPLELFSPQNFMELIRADENVAAAFWFPISLSILALNERDIGFETRKYLLESAFWFLVFYKELFDKTESISLRQRKHKENLDVMFYTSDLLIEFTNTLHCQLQLMETVPNFCFDRNSTTPLEHKFGNARIRAHDIHTLNKFIKNISIMQACDRLSSLEAMTHFDVDFKIRGRTNSFGVTVEKNNHEFSFDYSPQSFARAMLLSAGFSVEYPEEFNVGEIFDFGFSLIESLLQDKQQGSQKRKNFTVTGSLAFAKSTKAQQRLNQLNVPKKEDKIRVIEEYLEGHFGERYTKKNILAVLEKLRSEIDSSLPFPKSSAPKQELFDFLLNNLGPFYPIMSSFTFKPE